MISPVQISPSAQRQLKWPVAVLLFTLLVMAIWLLFTTDSGRRIQKDPALLKGDVQRLVEKHPLGAGAMFLVVYVVIASLGVLPVWWLQILAGMGFGLFAGAFLSLIAATVGAVLGMLVSRWFAADWFHKRVESKMERLRKLDHTLGHNGFLVVMAVRLVHLLPFGLSNYALGLIEISIMDVLMGTFLGSIPSISLSVGIGAGYRPRNWRFITILAGINLVLLIPIAARYLRPQWFRKIGVE